MESVLETSASASVDSHARGDILSPRKRIVLADDHIEMLDEVRALLSNDYEIVATAENGQELVRAAQELKPDLIVSDISMPEMTGFEAAAKIREAGLSSKIIFLTVQSAAAYVKKARALGASGYVLKVYTTEQLPVAIASVLTGQFYVSPQLKATGWS
jgi:DNA-binding NarL/FixJ family response regulator